MRLKRKILMLFVAVFLIDIAAADKLTNLLRREISAHMAELQREEVKPYYISCRVDESVKKILSSSMGTPVSEDDQHEVILTVMVRVGSPELDNHHALREDISAYYAKSDTGQRLPLEWNPLAVRYILRNSLEKAYREAVSSYSKVLSNVSLKVTEDDSAGDYSSAPVIKRHIGRPKRKDINTALWRDTLAAASASFLEEPYALYGEAQLIIENTRKYFIDSEGSAAEQGYRYARLTLESAAKADDGMVLPVYKSWVAETPEGLPAFGVLKAEAERLTTLMGALTEAPLVGPYTGPVILSGEASGVFFHEIFGHRVEGQRMKKVTDGQTFKTKIGERVLPEALSVYSDPLSGRYRGDYLWGHYDFDDEGVKGRRTEIITNGVLKGFLMSRTPIDGFPFSNGHGRAAPGKTPVARQSNLIIETSRGFTPTELRGMLTDALNAKGLEYGYYIESVTGGFTQTGRYVPNSFNVTPIVVYRVFADGRPDQLVRGVDLIGTPLSMFSHISAAGTDHGVFSGYCGAESGSVPVSCVSPSLYVEQIELQKKGRSQEKRTILPRPDTDTAVIK